jgi:ribose-phosphate pyrophosphokinase
MRNEIKLYGDGNELNVRWIEFNGGEVQPRIDIVDNIREFTIEARIANSIGVMKLVMLHNAIKQNYDHYNCGLNLFLPYVPYARQDRVCNPGEPLAIKAMANLINDMQFDHVTIYDPHSDVTSALIDDVIVVEQHDLFYTFKQNKRFIADIIVAPDGGALKKAFKCAQKCGSELATAQKFRNLDDGQIVETKFDWNYGLAGHHVWVVDDICDGGRTFVELAKIIKAKNPASLNLFVTHGIFSKGTTELYQYYDRIGTTDSFLSDAVLNSEVEVLNYNRR